MNRTFEHVMAELEAASARNAAAREGLCRAFDMLRAGPDTPDLKAEVKAISKEATEATKSMRKLLKEAKSFKRGAA